jgi:hypothetical protein
MIQLLFGKFDVRSAMTLEIKVVQLAIEARWRLLMLLANRALE